MDDFSKKKMPPNKNKGAKVRKKKKKHTHFCSPPFFMRHSCAVLLGFWSAEDARCLPNWWISTSDSCHAAISGRAALTVDLSWDLGEFCEKKRYPFWWICKPKKKWQKAVRSHWSRFFFGRWKLFAFFLATGGSWCGAIWSTVLVPCGGTKHSHSSPQHPIKCARSHLVKLCSSRTYTTKNPSEGSFLISGHPRLFQGKAVGWSIIIWPDHIIISTFFARTTNFLSLGLGTGNKDSNQISWHLLSCPRCSDLPGIHARAASSRECSHCDPANESISSGCLSSWKLKVGSLWLKSPDFIWFPKLHACWSFYQKFRVQRDFFRIFLVPRCPPNFSLPQQKWVPEVQLQQYGCQYLCSMAQAMPDVREEILKLGGIRPIIAAMNNYPQEPPAPSVGFARMAGWEIFWHGKCDENGNFLKIQRQACQMLWHVFMDHGSQDLYNT